jgi:hypothetical protein
VYDVRAAKYLGCTDPVRVTAQPGDAHRFTLMPYHANALRISVAATTRPGGSLRYAVEVLGADGQTGLHSFRIRPIEPPGRVRHEYDTNAVARSDRYIGAIPIAL